MMETKIVSKIRKSEDIKKKIYKDKVKKSLLSQARKGLESFEEVYFEIEECWNNNEAILFVDKSVIFYPELLLLMDTKESSKIEVEKLRYFDKSDWKKYLEGKEKIQDKWQPQILKEREARKIFCEYQKESRINNYTQIVCSDEKDRNLGCFVNNGEFVKLINLDNKSNSNDYSRFILKSLIYNSISTLRVPLGYHFNENLKTKLQIIVAIGGIPKTIKEKKLLKSLINLCEKGYVSISSKGVELTNLGKEAIANGKCRQIGRQVLSLDKIPNSELDGENILVDISKMSFEEKKSVFAYYAVCDKERANINEYDISWLEDPNQGHWELWDGNEGLDLVNLSSENKVYARNPKCDIKSDCIVGIDFGTKSTVVVCQNESGVIRPLPIGNGNIRKELEARDFENPTVMQFIDFEHFIQNYMERDGRPYTKWEDLIISHAANESMKDTGIRSDEFYSYLYDLKQWAGEEKKSIILRDKKGNDLLLEAYNELVGYAGNSVDAIEIYAYYIGLYINNMNNGIYLEYLLSFPVTYEKKIRNKILKSFEAGLKKSLPQSIINDMEVMEQFSVAAGASEPAAYAICALEEYGFEPAENDKVFYGIFDFGGGTSDFDFGLWTKSKEDDLYDYCIEHFGTQGDRYLGGENLLQIIAFEVFTENIQLCREYKIPFAKPIECINIPTELAGYVNDSQEARMNQKLMMEKLRPYWERTDEKGEIKVELKEYTEFQVGLFDIEGSLKSNLAFEVNIEKLELIIHQRIEKGVNQFFEALKDTFSIKHIRKTASADKINIFLAGNSSKSPILQEIFCQNIEKWNKSIALQQKEKKEIGHFVLFPPLGTVEAVKRQEERGIFNEQSLEAPTGKTGVAWGLIEGREGGRIEVKEEVSFEDEAKFAYYLGIQKGKKFFPKIRRDEEYQKWIKFLPARRKVNEILYTSLPEAVSGTLNCGESGVLRKRIEVPVNGNNQYIYLRFVSTNIFEYAVGDETGNIDELTIKTVEI